MSKGDQIKTLRVAIEDYSNIIRKMTAEIGNYDVQIAEYQQIVKELSDKLKLYENKYGKVFKSAEDQK